MSNCTTKRQGIVPKSTLDALINSSDFIENLSYNKQRQVVSILSGEIYKASLETGKAYSKTIKGVVEDIYKKISSNISSLQSDKETLELINDDGSQTESIFFLDESIRDNQKILENLNTLGEMALTNLNSYSNVTLTKLESTTEDKQTDEEESSLERTSFADNYSLELNSMNTASSRLKKFMSFVNDYEFVGEDLVKRKSIINTALPLNFEYVYNELHRILEGVRAKESAVLSRLSQVNEEVKQNKIQHLAWLDSFINQLKNSDKQTRKEFISDMAKHKTDMEFVMYDRYYNERDKVWNNTLRVYQDNSNSTTRRTLTTWGKAHETSRIVENGKYSQEVKSQLLEAVAASRQTKNDNLKGSIINEVLDSLGVNLHPDFISSLFTGNGSFYHNGSSLSGQSLINKGGLLESFIDNIPTNTDVNQALLTGESLFYSLANANSKYTKDEMANSFRVADKTIYTYTNNHYLSGRVRDLKEGTNKLDQALFAKESLYLTLLNDPDFKLKNWFNVNYLSLNPIKHKGKKRRSDKVTKVSPMDLEVTKIGMYNSGRGYSPVEINGITYQVRKAKYFLPTNSDKSRIMKGDGYSFESTSRIVIRDKQGNKRYKTEFKDTALDLFYNSVIVPEINRIFSTSQPSFEDNNKIEGYNGKLFYLFPSLNNLNIKFADTQESIPLLDLVQENPDLESAVVEQIKKEIDRVLKSLVKKKIESWIDLGIIEGNTSNFIETIENSSKEKSSIASTAMDFVYNYAMFNTNMFQLIIGDPSQYFKKSVQGTVDNIFKRLAAEIAPGLEFEGEDYVQLYARDRESSSTFFEYYLKALDGLTLKEYNNLSDKKKRKLKSYPYTSIEGTDAQEYTTWREHLNILRDMGRISDKEYEAASSAFKEGTLPNKKVFNKVLQPLKPVYVNNRSVTVGDFNIDKKTYIKSSSFPLIPTLTKGLEIDKLREKMESIESKSNLGVRLAYKTATKVGFPTNALEIFDEDGNIADFEITEEQWRDNIYSREGFKIQQDLPYDSKKSKVGKGSQESKLLWANVLDYEFTYNGDKVAGKQLYDTYVQTYKEIYNYGLDKLKRRFTTSSGAVDIQMISKLLGQELRNRGENNKAILDGLTVEDKEYIENGKSVTRKDFKVPLWLSPYRDKYASLIASLVKNNVVAQKLPGTSLVLGSEEGFRYKNSIEGETGIVFTDSFTGELKPQHIDAEGNVQPAQIIIPFKFRDNDGNLLNLENFVKDGKLDTKKLPKELLKSFGFRIPTQLHSSMSYMEIVGFLPSTSGDLIIAPREFTKQMGSDFDIDKLYSYLYHTQYDFSTKSLSKTEQINSSDLVTIKSEIRSLRKQLTSIYDNANEVYSDILSQISFLQSNNQVINIEVLSNYIKGLHPEVESNLISSLVENIVNLDRLESSYHGGLANKLLDIHLTVVGDKNVQNSILTPLDSGLFLNEITYTIDKEERSFEGYVNLINTINSSQQEDPLVIDEAYQTNKFYDGTSGKDGISMFSSDSVFNVAAQDKDIVIQDFVQEGDKVIKVPITVKFGNKYEVSRGNISGTETLKKDSTRKKTSLISAAQNLSVDNAKDQGMFVVNMNNFTFPAYSVLNFLGFEEDISAPLMSQPIIVEYVKKMQQSKSILKPYVPDVENEIVTQLISKYTQGKSYDSRLADFSGKDASKTMIDLLIYKEEHPQYGEYQAALLERFMYLKEQERKIAPLKQFMNIDSKGFHKSMYINKNRLEQVESLPELPLIQNADKLIGDYVYEDIGSIQMLSLITPTTLAGLDNVYGTKELVNTFGNLFLGSSSAFNFFGIIRDLTRILTTNNQLSNQDIQDIENAYTSYLITNFKEPIADLRKDLFTNTKEGSLYNNLKKLQDTGYWNNNSFLNSLEMNLNNGVVYIDYNNSGGDIFDETGLYLSFIDLFRQNEELNGVIPSMIAEDLVRYAILRGDVKAKQFIKLIPPDILNKFIDIPLGIYNTSVFIDQYIRHNADKLPVINDFEQLNETTIRTSEENPDYVALEDGSIYKKNKIIENYEKISKLGGDLFTEYSLLPNNTSIIKTNNVKENPLEQIDVNNIAMIKLQEQNPGDIAISNQIASEEKVTLDDVYSQLDFSTPLNLLESISSITSYPEFANLASVLKDVIPNDIEILVNDSYKVSYNHDARRITYGTRTLQTFNNKELLSGILHELMHAVTGENIRNYNNGNLTDVNIRSAIYRITNYKNSLIDSLNEEQTAKFRNVTVKYLNDKTEAKLQSLLNDTTVHSKVRGWIESILSYRQSPEQDLDSRIKQMIDEAINSDYTIDDTISYYALLNSTEFMAVSSTMEEARTLFDEISGGTYIDRIKQFFREILEALGITSESSQSLVDDILKVANVSVAKKLIATKNTVELNREENALFKYTDGNTYLMKSNQVYDIRDTKNVVEMPQSFINKYITELSSKVNYSLNEFENKEYKDFKDNPKLTAKLLAAKNDIQNNKRLVDLYNVLYNEHFVENSSVPLDKLINKEYSLHNLPTKQQRVLSPKTTAMKYATKVLTEDNQVLKDFNASLESLYNTLDKEGEEIKRKCEGDTPKAEHGMRLGSSSGTWSLVKDLKGLPSHAQGGVNLRIDGGKVLFNSKEGTIEAAHGLFVPYNLPVQEEYKPLQPKIKGKWSTIGLQNSKLYAEHGVIMKWNKKNKDFTSGNIWTLVKDLEGFPSHNQGGIDIFVDDNQNVGFTNNGTKIKAACGCVISGNHKATPTQQVIKKKKRYIKQK